MTDPRPRVPVHFGPVTTDAPTITAMAGGIITGAGFLPDHEVVVCINYIADGISDYLTYTTDSHGRLYAEPPISAGIDTLHIAATEHRPNPDGAYGLLWGNADVLHP